MSLAQTLKFIVVRKKHFVAVVAERDGEIRHDRAVVLISNWSPPLLHHHLCPVQLGQRCLANDHQLQVTAHLVWYT